MSNENQGNIEEQSEECLSDQFVNLRYLARNPINPGDYAFPIEVDKGFILDSENNIAVIREKTNGAERYLLESIRSGISKRIFIEIDEAEFSRLWDRAKELKISKTEYLTSFKTEGLGDVSAIVSEYHGALNGLNLVEVNFPTMKHTYRFFPDKHGFEEVSERRDYEESSMVLSGLPRHFTGIEEKYPKHIPQYPLDEGKIRMWLELCIRKQKVKNDCPIIASVAGGSNSGKTQIVAKYLEDTGYLNVTTLSLDNYYHGKTWMEEQRKNGIIINWDQPEALNLDLLKQHIAQLKRGETVEVPIYDFTISEPDPVKKLVINPKKWTSETRKKKHDPIAPLPEHIEVILIEGLFALNEKLLDESDLKVFVASDAPTRLVRRLARDCIERGRSPESVLKAFSEVVNPMHEVYVEPSSKYADMIIHNPLLANVEGKNSGLHEVQLKFKAHNISHEKLIEIGAVHLETLTQSDIYHDPKDRNLMETQEMMRIRTQKSENQKHETKYFTYKGLKSENAGTTTRPIFECEVGDDFDTVFSKTHGFESKQIIKVRRLYKLDGLIFSLDKVRKIVCEKEIELGNFIELRSIENIPDVNAVGNMAINERVSTCERTALEKLAQKLGIEKNELIKESYFEM